MRDVLVFNEDVLTFSSEENEYFTALEGTDRVIYAYLKADNSGSSFEDLKIWQDNTICLQMTPAEWIEEYIRENNVTKCILPYIDREKLLSDLMSDWTEFEFEGETYIMS